MREIAAAIIAHNARAQRLEELRQVLEGEALAEAIGAAELATDADRDLFFEVYAAALGPFDLAAYGAYQDKIAERLEGLGRIKELFFEGLATAEQWADAFAVILATWRALEPWREHLRQELENQPDWIEHARKLALKAKGYRIPTERRSKRKASEAELLNRRLRQMRGEV